MYLESFRVDINFRYFREAIDIVLPRDWSELGTRKLKEFPFSEMALHDHAMFLLARGKNLDIIKPKITPKKLSQIDGHETLSELQKAQI